MTSTAELSDPSSQPSNGVDGSSDSATLSASASEPTPTPLESELSIQPSVTSQPTIGLPETVLGLGVDPTSTPAPISLPSTQSSGVTMHPMTQHLLIAAGTIGKHYTCVCPPILIAC